MEKHATKVRRYLRPSILYGCSCDKPILRTLMYEINPITLLKIYIIFTIYLVHPCDEENNGGCSQICNKRNEKHECSCEVGFILKKDKRACKKG